MKENFLTKGLNENITLKKLKLEMNEKQIETDLSFIYFL